jgi:quercetin dioxygenase-like cupin family protein
MAVEPVRARQDGPADVALVTLAPGIATPWESHADAAESLRLLSGCLCVEMTFAERHVPVDLSEVSGQMSFTIEAGVRHRLIAVYHSRPTVFLVVMRPTAGEVTERHALMKAVCVAAHDWAHIADDITKGEDETQLGFAEETLSRAVDDLIARFPDSAHEAP